MNASARAVAAVFVAATLCVPAACTRDGGAPVQAQAGRAAADAQACLPRVRGGWIRLVPGGGMPMDAGYATIDNPCDAPVVVTAAGSRAYADVSLHESMVDGGMSRMRPVPELRIAAHGHARLQPGGLHLMLMAPRARPKVGDHVAIRLQLQDGRGVDGGFEVRPAVP